MDLRNHASCNHAWAGLKGRDAAIAPVAEGAEHIHTRTVGGSEALRSVKRIGWSVTILPCTTRKSRQTLEIDSEIPQSLNVQFLRP